MSTAEEQFDETLTTIDRILKRFIGINLRILEDTNLRRTFMAILIATASFDLGALLHLGIRAHDGLTFDDCDVVPKLIISIMSTVKLVLTRVHEAPHGRLLLRLREKLSQNQQYIAHSHHLRARIDRELSSVNIIAKVMYYNSISTLALFMISPFIFMPYYYLKEHRLVIYTPMAVSYIFCDSYDLVGWILTYFHTGIKGVVSIAGFSCEVLVLCQLSLLHAALSTLACRVRGGEAPLRSIVIEHQQLLLFSDMLNAVLSESMLCFFMGSTFLICFVAFIISTVNENLVSFLLLLSLYIGLIFMINYFGNKIIDASTEVAHAVYESPWYEQEQHSQHTLHIMMMRSEHGRAQRPCALTVYKFAPIDIPTFTKVLSSAWSYFALLRTFYTKE